MYIKVSDTQFKRRASKYKEQKKPLSQILLASLFISQDCFHRADHECLIHYAKTSQ